MPQKPVLVIKIGTSTLTAETTSISRGKIEDIARQLVELRADYHIVLVSSGAVATAKQFVNLTGWNHLVQSKQALAAVGQPRLMQIYNEVFNDFGLTIAQCLLTYRDFELQECKTNTLNTIHELLAHGFIPIINENDTVAVEELIVGDNDKLSAHTAVLLKARALMIATDTDGLFTKNPHKFRDAEHITSVSDIQTIIDVVDERNNELGTGGMSSKLEAAQLCMDAGIETILVNGNRNRFILNGLHRDIPTTRFRC